MALGTAYELGTGSKTAYWYARTRSLTRLIHDFTRNQTAERLSRRAFVCQVSPKAAPNRDWLTTVFDAANACLSG